MAKSNEILKINRDSAYIFKLIKHFISSQSPIVKKWGLYFLKHMGTTQTSALFSEEKPFLYPHSCPDVHGILHDRAGSFIREWYPWEVTALILSRYYHFDFRKSWWWNIDPALKENLVTSLIKYIFFILSIHQIP